MRNAGALLSRFGLILLSTLLIYLPVTANAEHCDTLYQQCESCGNGGSTVYATDQSQGVYAANCSGFNEACGELYSQRSCEVPLDASIMSIEWMQPGIDLGHTDFPNNPIWPADLNQPMTVAVRVSIRGFNLPETRTAVIRLQLGSQIFETSLPMAEMQERASPGSGVARYGAFFGITFNPADGLDQQTMTATISPGNVFQEANFTNNVRVVSVPLQPTGDQGTISVTETHFEQVVEDPQLLTNTSSNIFDAVVGKSSSFKLKLTGANLGTATGFVVAKVLSGATVISQSSPILVSHLVATGSYVILPHEMSKYIPQSPGLLPLTVEIDTSNATGVTSPSDGSLTLNAHQVRVPTIGFAGIVPTFGYNAPTAQRVSTSLTSDKFVSATFPVRDNAFNYSLTTVMSSIEGTSAPGSPKFAFWGDLVKLELQRRALGLDRMVAVVDGSYFRAYFPGLPITGLNWIQEGISAKSVFVQAGQPEVVAHELGHSFGQQDHFYTTDANQPTAYTNEPVQGFDGLSNMSYFWPAVVQPFAQTAVSLMGPSGLGGGLSPSPYNYWVDKATYEKVFTTMVTPAPADAETFLFAGILTKSGAFTFLASQTLPAGKVTPNTPSGDVTVALLGANNQVLSQTSVAPIYELHASGASGEPGGPSTIQTDETAVIVELPNNPAATAVQISKAGAVLHRKSLVTVPTQPLDGLIASIPDRGFVKPDNCVKNPGKNKGQKEKCDNYIALARSELNALVADIQKALAKKNQQGAKAKLEKLIDEVREKTSKNYAVTSPAERTQSQVIAEIRKVLNDLDRHCGKRGR